MATVHPFEKSGLGRAPFRCVGVHENFIKHADGSTQAGGCCDYCGTGIRWEYMIRSSDNKGFVVGCDCVAKTEGALVEDFDKVRKTHARERRQVKAAVRREAREAAWKAQREAWKAEREVERAQWREENAELVARLQAYTGQNDFIHAMKANLAEWGGLTGRMTDAVLRAFQREDERALAAQRSKHVGTVGVRQRNVRVKITGSRYIGENNFVYPPKPRILVSMQTESGDELVWWTDKSFKVSDEFYIADFGIKEHGEYNGIAQTTVLRVKFHQQGEEK